MSDMVETMAVKNSLQKMFHYLLDNEHVQMSLGGYTITLKIVEQNALFLSTTIYFGGNYIPKSVRNCLNEKPPFQSNLFHARPKINENSFLIDLNLSINLMDFEKEEFISLVEEFAWLAGEWRFYLDDHDKKDLIHVRSSST